MIYRRKKRKNKKESGSMAKKLRRGFTIIELVVVIAVIAILAAILIPTFTSLMDKANLSADQQAVQQMNTILTAEGVENKPKDVEEAKKILQNAGYNVDSYVPMDKDNIFYYDLSENKVLIYDQKEHKVTYPQEMVDKYVDYTDGRLSLEWYMLNDKTYQQVTVEGLGAKTLTEAITMTTSYQTIVLEGDSEISDDGLTESKFPVNSDGTASIDLNGHTLTIDWSLNGIDFGQETTVRLKNGTIETSGGFMVGSRSYFELENINYKAGIGGSSSKVGAFLFLGGSASEVLVKNCHAVVTGAAFGISTNAGDGRSKNVIARVEDSTVISESFSVLVNVEGKYYFKNCTLQGDGGGVMVRGGDATFENCQIVEKGDNADNVEMIGNSEFSLSDGVASMNMFMDGIWGTGNKVQWGGLIVGDWSESYAWDASCTLINTEVRMEDTADLPAVYLSQDTGNTTTFTYDGNCRFVQHADSVFESTVTVNNAAGVGNVQRGTVIINGETYVW